jgi:hypothetical protein
MTQIKFGAAASVGLPGAKILLSLNVKGSISDAELLSIFRKAYVDTSLFIAYVKRHDWQDAIELGISDAVALGGILGVPGMNVAATLLPYVWDLTNSAISHSGRISVQALVEGALKAQSNLGLIIAELERRQYIEALQLELNDLLNIAALVVPAPYIAIGKIAVTVGFGIVEYGGLAGMIDEAIGQMLDGIGRAFQLPSDVAFGPHGEIYRGPYRYDAVDGWIYDPAVEKSPYTWDVFQGWVLKEKTK